MAISPLITRRFAVAAGIAAAIASAPALTLLSTPGQSLAACPNGESEDTYTGVCVPDLVPNSPKFNSAPNQLPQINGIPCNGANSGQCIGLAEEQQARGPQPIPQSTVGSSPTVTGHIG
ncbi:MULTISPECIES: intersectin-EH binding protein Ibp1 [unclassified Mycolicibacterium]|uniref:intersectin-EH binding protein Ibp1 n=1 Tax=unclassified Mycolicibacterium TaxID=2636767 RepID=UPI0012DCB385|nr:MULTISPECIES: intersectin-EH binding protein Ibp1 [unclassified Mycolicibacterium]MUL83911.1 intersectin-EH binding protein Ibp1 [Mycolicibacterium sp. CBMA 329]MUL90023.1 intersectin-EH binding protein Ibp1 [Mycolicibacterium sp. CBMA 331]MUL97957.1 intersectin-EH binding protein Ibp1 [Mycolicibacterium sp. CBMA 334]MUM27889.1 intersectin-EH binding protein Ibp1 [Mycolicibacterium sp. CBMA 295]MUM39538.1 intersectin-EH binding protein Ibp1 [Mycolicibacterium sp. CBMA 247]